MYDVYFSYFDGNDHLCTNVDKIEIPTSSGIRTYLGDEIASQHFSIPKNDTPTQKYCIIFGQLSQSEHLFLDSCYFYTHFPALSGIE